LSASPASPRVALVSGDAGSASVLMPLVDRLNARGVATEVHASGPALALWKERAPREAVEAHPEPVSLESARRLLAGATALASGAGAFNSIEHAFRLAAASGGIASVAVMDFWGRIGDRFSREIGTQAETSHPDWVCALDDDNAAELLKSGFPADRVLVTGSPYLEEVAGFFGRETGAQPSWRREFAIEPGERVVLFASEPFDASDRRPDGRGVYGYDQASSLAAVLHGCDDAARQLGERVLVVARPHPREEAGVLEGVALGWRSERVRVRVTAEGEARRWVSIADAVTGMTSVVLIEAALAGKTALSVQIGLRESGHGDPNRANAAGLSLLILDEPALASALKASFAGNGFRPAARRLQALAGRGCGDRVVDVILRALGRRS
jgi:hypothetical protein